MALQGTPQGSLPRLPEMVLSKQRLQRLAPPRAPRQAPREPELAQEGPEDHDGLRGFRPEAAEDFEGLIDPAGKGRRDY